MARTSKILLCIALAVCGVCFPAMANSVDLTLTNDALLGPGPYGTVVYVLDGNAIDVTVTMNAPYLIKGLDGPDFGFNILGSTDGLAVTNVGYQTLSLSSNVDGFGVFDAVIQHLSTDNLAVLSFTVTRTAGFSSADQLFDPNAMDASFVAHVVAASGYTGYVADGPTGVPEPGTALVMLSGLGFLAAGMVRWRKRAS